MLGLNHNQISFSSERIPPENMADLYNIADCTVCLSNNEGFGLSSLESMMCGTPVISVRTGGLQDQNYDAETGKEYGVSIFPRTKSLTGSQQIPYIFDCRCPDEDIIKAYLKMYNMSKDDAKKLGQECVEHARSLFKLSNMINSWDEVIQRKVSEFKDGYPERIRFSRV